jgi:maintenance of morphology protein 1
MLRHRTSTILRPSSTLATNTDSILRKTYYNALSHSHQPESLDWFNVLIAQTISEYRAVFNSDSSSILSSLSSALNDPTKKPSFLDDIAVTEISIGDEFPIFSNCRVISIDEDGGSGRLQALMDVDLADNLTLGIETKLLLNYPKPFSAILPLALAVSVVRFSGTLSVSFLPSAPVSAAEAVSEAASLSSPPKTSLAFSFLPDYRLELSVRSLVGSRSRLQDVPKIAQLVEWRVQQWFEERVVEPRVQVVALPGIWPRMRNTNMRTDGDGSSSRPDDEASRGYDSNEEATGLKLRKTARVAEDDTPTSAALEMPGSMPGMLP